MAEESYWDKVKRLFDMDVDEAVGQASDVISQNWNRGIGYASGYWAGLFSDMKPATVVVRDEDIPFLPTPIKRTPLYTFMRMASGADSVAGMKASKEADIAMGNYRVLMGQVEAMEAAGNTQITGEAVELLRDVGVVPKWVTKDYTFSTEFARSVIQAKMDEAGPKTSEAVNTKLRTNAVSIVSGLNAISPLLVATAGLKPKYTRELMGIHLVSDALSGVLNFRDPQRNIGLVDTLSPYATMVAVGLANRVAGGFR
jgi:hypothetical protein